MNSGKLMSTKCSLCEHVIWPPSNVCPQCLSNKIEWMDIDTNGKLIEFSESFLEEQSSVFGVVELDHNVRLIAKIQCLHVSQLKKGLPVRMLRCGMKNSDPYYEFQPI
ncbi:MAG: Zn-ribbon domain-containing OB-fold protein [Nitrososphaerales archaeon]